MNPFKICSDGVSKRRRIFRDGQNPILFFYLFPIPDNKLNTIIKKKKKNQRHILKSSEINFFSKFSKFNPEATL
jgi:hypothetical protein